MTKKYFFIDIDDTLTDRSTGKVVPSALEALKKLREAGHFVAIATGRAHYKAIHFMKDNGFDNMVCNGGHGIVFNGELVENKGLDFEKAYAVYQEARDLGYGIYTAVDDSHKVYANDFLFHEQVGMRKEPSIYIIDPEFDPKTFKEIFKMYVAVPEKEEKLLKSKEAIGHLRFEKEYLMFQPDAKLAGIYRLLEIAGADSQDVVVFGDGRNDIDMFNDHFYRIAMGNACPELKELADYITDDNIQDGIYKACQAHNWWLD
ncbi:hydrolase [Streptococcus bovimastitidis]|uniref:Hydrolase n=1 Tax=Streptococcus bovimastitidis TaxID=1856638 RepID=A0A1L8ML35_9STRE|nr:HAD family hydrolase [Streptococcus bovimastitidis]OJF71477.1 hydrolase [Streptococcus bovimastitidis]